MSGEHGIGIGSVLQSHLMSMRMCECEKQCIDEMNAAYLCLNGCSFDFLDGMGV